MKTYKQVLETVELALSKGEYHYCIEFLLPLIESFPLSSKEGVNLRTILITALCGIYKKEEAKRFCKELLKSYDNKTRENAKYLMEVIDSPDIKKPENWNVQFESHPSLNKKSLNSLRKKRDLLKKKKFTLPLLTLVHVICTFGLITVLPQFLYEYSNGELIKFDINLVYTLIFLALFPSIGSYYCWAGAVSIIGANRAGIFLSLIPLFSTIMAILFYNEQFKFFHLIGAILIILGLFLSNKEIKYA